MSLIISLKIAFSFNLAVQLGLTESDTVKTAAEGLYLGLLDIQPAMVGGTLSGHLNNLPRQVAAIESSSQSIGN